MYNDNDFDVNFLSPLLDKTIIVPYHDKQEDKGFKTILSYGSM